MGRTLPERQIHDLLAAFKLISSRRPEYGRAAIYGEESMAPHAIYAAMLCDDIREIILKDPPHSHRSPDTAEFLSVLRIGDLPHNLALVHPKRITFIGGVPDVYKPVKKLWGATGKKGLFKEVAKLDAWIPSL